MPIESRALRGKLEILKQTPLYAAHYSTARARLIEEILEGILDNITEYDADGYVLPKPR